MYALNLRYLVPESHECKVQATTKTATISGLPSSETTLAKTLKGIGYSTAIIGKWHLGVGANKTYLPTNRGFDYYMVVKNSVKFCYAMTVISLGYSLFTRHVSLHLLLLS